MLSLFRSIYRFRELLAILVGRNIKIRYKRSVLGFLWSFLNPIFLIVIYATFLRLLKFYDPENTLFLPMLVTGIIAWQFTSMGVSDCLHAVLGNANLVKKTSFPRLILPLATVLADLVHFLLSLLILVVYILIIGSPVSRLWLLPLVILTQFALCAGLGFIVASLNVFFRDMEHLVGVGMLAWFFLSPIIYPFETVPEHLQRLALLNPMAGIVTCYRGVFLSTSLMAPRLLVMSLGMSWLILVLGVSIFQRTQKEFGDRL